MFERFTDRARRVVDAASRSALGLGHNFVGTEHLLLGLYDQPEGLAARALAEAGIDRDAVEAKVLEMVPRGEPMLENPPYTPRASLALQGALEEALGLGHNYIGTEHILLGLMRDPHALSARALGELGVSPERIRSRLVEMVNAIAQQRRQG